jgi:hypothetical protein
MKSTCMCEAKHNVLTFRNDKFADYKTRSYGKETFYFLEERMLESVDAFVPEYVCRRFKFSSM